MSRTWTLSGKPSTKHSAPFENVDFGERLPRFSVSSHKLKSGLSQGVEIVELGDDCIKLAVLPTRGMGLHKVWVAGVEIGWQSPVQGPVHPHFVPLSETSGLGWLDGFDELLVRCGLESNGAPQFDLSGSLVFPLHGRIANLPAHRVELLADDEAGSLSLIGEVDEQRFHFQKLRLRSTYTLRPAFAGFTLHDEIINIGGSPATAQLLYHINFGPPLLGPGSRFIAAVSQVVPRDATAAASMGDWSQYGAPQAGFVEQVYFLQLLADAQGQGQAILVNAAGDLAVRLTVDTRALPYFTLWKDTGAEQDGYVTGLEPGTNFPNIRSFEQQQGRVVRLAAGESVDFRISFEVLSDAPRVAEAVAQVESLQTAVPRIAHGPEAPWCAL